MNKNFPPENYPKGGIGIFLIDTNENKVLVGIRKDNGSIALPGGWLEFGEEWEECGSRELKEETGLDIDPVRIFHMKTFNCFNPETQYHNVAIYLMAEIEENEKPFVTNTEPHKCEGWFWVDYDFLVRNYPKLFFPLQVFLKFNQTDSIKRLKDLIRIF